MPYTEIKKEIVKAEKWMAFDKDYCEISSEFGEWDTKAEIEIEILNSNPDRFIPIKVSYEYEK